MPAFNMVAEQPMTCECCSDLSWEDVGRQQVEIRYQGKKYVGGTKQFIAENPWLPFRTSSPFWSRYRKGICLKESLLERKLKNLNNQNGNYFKKPAYILPDECKWIAQSITRIKPTGARSAIDGRF